MYGSHACKYSDAKGNDEIDKASSGRFACYSGFDGIDPYERNIFMFLKWNENDGGCDNSLIGKYQYFIRLQQFRANPSPLREGMRIFLPILHQEKCRMELFTNRQYD